jgi:hypothetical protein
LRIIALKFTKNYYLALELKTEKMADFITNSFDEEGYDYKWKRGVWLLMAVAALCVAALGAYVYLADFYLKVVFAAFLLCKGVLEMLFAKRNRPDLGNGMKKISNKEMREMLEFQLGYIDFIFCAAMIYTLFGTSGFWINANVIILLWLLVETFWINLAVSTGNDNFEKVYRMTGGLSMLLFIIALITFIWAKNSFVLVGFCLLFLFVVHLVMALGQRKKVSRLLRNYKHVPTLFTRMDEPIETDNALNKEFGLKNNTKGGLSKLMDMTELLKNRDRLNARQKEELDEWLKEMDSDE